MVHRLRNWILLRDLMCSNKEMARYVIIESLKATIGPPPIGGFPKPPIREDMVNKMIDVCGCNISQDGFEICLLTWREDISDLFICTGVCSDFERFLKMLDAMLADTKKTMAEEHRL